MTHKYAPEGLATSVVERKTLDWLRRYGRTSSSYLTLDKNLERFTVLALDGCIGYVKHANVAIALEPVCSPAHCPELVHEFKSFCAKNNWASCFFGCTEEGRGLLKECGFKTLYIGSEPFVAMDEFTTAGGKMGSVRRGINHAKRVGVRVEECFPERDDDARAELYAVTEKWLRTRATPELAFMVGHLSFALPDRRYFVAYRERRVTAFIVYNPLYPAKSYYLDLNRRAMDAPNGAMELLFVESFEKLKQEGVQRVYLGLSPFSNAQGTEGENGLLLTKLMTYLYEHFEFLYPAKSEYFFKSKFSTGWERRYMCYHPQLSPRLIYAIFLAFCPAGLRSVISYKLRRWLDGLMR